MISRVLGVVSDVIVVVFVIYLVRHLLFLTVALRRRPLATSAGSAESAGSAGSTGSAGSVAGVHTGSLSATVVVPCHNEELVVPGLVDALETIVAPPGGLQIVIVDDRSSDGTGEELDRLVAERALPWRIIHRHPEAVGGKSAALNDILDVATGDVVVVYDADHRPDPDAVLRLVRLFLDPTVGSAQGRCIVRNGKATPLARLVALDYLCGYLVNMVGRDQAYSLPAYGGANCAVRTSALREVGGWNEASVTEDTDLTMRLLLEGWRVAYDPEAIDVEQAVTTVPRFWRQRYRWARGHQQVCADYRIRALRSRQFAISQKIETQLFLYAFHLPVLCLLAIGLVTLDALVGFRGGQSVDLWPLIPLMMAGPILEIGGGMIVAGTRRLRALDLLLFPILYVISMGVCTKALIDRSVRRGYSWHKTERSRDVVVAR